VCCPATELISLNFPSVMRITGEPVCGQVITSDRYIFSSVGTSRTTTKRAAAMTLDMVFLKLSTDYPIQTHVVPHGSRYQQEFWGCSWQQRVPVRKARCRAPQLAIAVGTSVTLVPRTDPDGRLLTHPVLISDGRWRSEHQERDRSACGKGSPRLAQSAPLASSASTATTEKFGSNGSDQVFLGDSWRERSGRDASNLHEGRVTNVSRLRSDSGAHLASEQSGVAFVGLPCNLSILR
jgi:hypothetical protein